MISSFERILNDSVGISDEQLRLKDHITKLHSSQRHRNRYPSFFRKRLSKRKNHFYTGLAIGDVNARLLALESKLPVFHDRNNYLHGLLKKNKTDENDQAMVVSEDDREVLEYNGNTLLKAIDDIQYLKVQEQLLNAEFQKMNVLVQDTKKKNKRMGYIYDIFKGKKLLDTFPDTENQEWKSIQMIVDGLCHLIKDTQKLDTWKLIHPSSQSQKLQAVFKGAPSVCYGNLISLRPDKILYRCIVRHVLCSISIVELMKMLDIFKKNNTNILSKPVDLSVYLVDTFRDWIIAVIERLCKKATEYMQGCMQLNDQYMIFLSWFLTIGLIPYESYECKPEIHVDQQRVMRDQTYVENNSISSMIWEKINQFLTGISEILNCPNKIVPMDDCILVRNQSLDTNSPMYKALRLSTKKETKVFVPSISHLINNSVSLGTASLGEGHTTVCGRMQALFFLCEEMQELHRKVIHYNSSPRVAFKQKVLTDAEKEEIKEREFMRREDSMKEQVKDLQEQLKDQNIEMASLEESSKENDQMLGEILALVESEQSITQGDVKRVLRYSLASRSGDLSAALKSIDELLSDTDVKSVEDYQLKCGIIQDKGRRDETRTYTGELQKPLAGTSNIEVADTDYNLKNLEINSAMDLFKSRQAMAFNLDGSRLESVKARMKQLEENRLATKQELEKWPTLFNLVTDLLLNEKTKSKLLRDSISKTVGTVNQLKAENMAFAEKFSELKNIYECQLDLQQKLMDSIYLRLNAKGDMGGNVEDTSGTKKDLLYNIISLIKKTRQLKAKVKKLMTTYEEYSMYLNECSIDFYKQNSSWLNASHGSIENNIIVADVSKYKSIETLELIEHNFNPQIPDLKFYEERLQDGWQSVISEFLHFLPEMTFCNKVVRYVETESTLYTLFKPFFDLLLSRKGVGEFCADMSSIMVLEKDGSIVKRSPTSVDEFVMTSSMLRSSQIGIYLDFLRNDALNSCRCYVQADELRNRSNLSLFDQAKKASFVPINSQNMDPASISALKA